MKDLIVNSLEVISKIAILFMVGAGFFGGWAFGNLFSALVGAVTAFIGAVTIFGGVFVLLEINDHVRAIRRVLERREASTTGSSPSLPDGPIAAAPAGQTSSSPSEAS